MTQIQTQKGLADTVSTALQTGISRRKALGASLGVAASIGTVAGGAKRAEAVIQPPLTAVITLGGTTYTFNETNGRDLGNFVSDIGGFTQRCVRTDVPGLPISVFFRPDLNSDRAEVVFEYGRVFYTGTPVNLGTYTVAISRGTQTLATVTVPNHYWFSRWRWQSSPRPVVANVATLITQKLLPPYDRSLVPPPAPATLPANYFKMPTGEYIDLNILQEIEAANYADVAKLVVPTSTINALLNSTSLTSSASSAPAQIYTVMGLAGVTPYMPTTGERPDIGLVTEPQAQFICTADAAALDTTRAQGEAAGTIPWHMRDENTSAPVNFLTYPKAAWFADQPGVGTPYVKTTSASPIKIDDAHQPALSYVPYLLTGDPYYLEELQFQATWNYGSLSTGYRPTLSQSRQFAWTIRTLGQCTKVTPATVPSWLLPQTYWASMLNAHRVFFETNYVNNPALCKSLFRATDNIDNRPADAAPAGTWCEPWQHDFLACVFGWLVQMGLTDWRTSFDWQIGSAIARSSATSGWIRAQASPYEMVLRATATSPYAQSWAEAWSLAQSVTHLTYTNPNTWVPTDMTYLTYNRGALVYAQQLGSVLTDNLTWATGQLNAKSWKTPYKWRLGTGLT